MEKLPNNMENIIASKHSELYSKSTLTFRP